jgi:hypothetical protein
MSFHQIIQTCDPDAVMVNHTITARATWQDPFSQEERVDERTLTLQQLADANAEQLYKGDVVVAYAKAFIVIAAMIENGEGGDTPAVAEAMTEWLDLAAETLDDPEIGEMADVMAQYAETLHAEF